MQLVVGLLNAGFAEAWVRQALHGEWNEGARHLLFASNGRARPHSTRERLINRAVAKGARFIAQNPPLRDTNEALAQLVQMRAVLTEHPSWWKGRGGGVDLAVMDACFEMAFKARRMSFGASIFQVADDAGIGDAAAKNSLRRLRTATESRPVLLTRQEVGQGKRASVYRFEGGTLLTNSCLSMEDRELVGTVPPAHDLWRNEALGKTKARVYGSLSGEPRSLADLARVLNLNEDHLKRRHLRPLRKMGLADYRDGWIRGAGDLDALAIDFGIAGKGAIVQDRRAAQRRQYRMRLGTRGGQVRAHEEVGDALRTKWRGALDATDAAASEETARRLMLWIRLRTGFDREFLEKVAERRGDDALRDIAEGMDAVSA